MSHETIEEACAARPGRPKGPSRLAVESALRNAGAFITQREIAKAANLPSADVNRIITTMLNTAAVHRNKAVPAGYRLGPAPAPTLQFAPRFMGAPYDGRELRPYSGRPGAMDAFTLPSLQSGRRVERRAPMLIGSTSEKRRPT